MFNLPHLEYCRGMLDHLGVSTPATQDKMQIPRLQEHHLSDPIRMHKVQMGCYVDLIQHYEAVGEREYLPQAGLPGASSSIPVFFRRPCRSSDKTLTHALDLEIRESLTGNNLAIGKGRFYEL